MEEKRYDVTIVGGGMTGLALAIALAKQKMSVCLVDRADLSHSQLPEFDGRVSAISLGSQYILQNLGLWEEMLPHAQPILDIRVHEVGGFGHVHYDHKQAGDKPMGHIIENRHTRATLLKKAKALKLLKLISPISIKQVKHEKNHAEIILDNDEVIRSSLLVAADGKRSYLREEMKIPTINRDYKQTAIVATIEHSQSHYGLALERFFPNGPFAVLPMQGNASSLVWVEPTEVAEAILALPEEQVEQYLAEKMDGYLGNAHITSKIWSYPLTAILAQSFIEKRFALLGDAAHGMHPIAGQGVNVGFRDVAALEQVLCDAKLRGEDLGSQIVLERYQKWRRLDATSMVGVTDGLNQLFSNHSALLGFARNTGFALVNKWPKIRDSFMRQAMGTEGELPRLARESNLT